MRKCPYLAHFGLKWKNKTTLFCQTFKVEEKKVVLFFNFELNQARYGHFLVFDIFALMSPFVKFEPPCGTPKSVPASVRRVKKFKFLIFLLSILENMQLTHINQIKTKKIDFGCRIIPIFLVFCRRDIIYHVCISLKTSQWPYHAYFSSKWKNKTTFFSSTLKVG